MQEWIGIYADVAKKLENKTDLQLSELASLLTKLKRARPAQVGYGIIVARGRDRATSRFLSRWKLKIDLPKRKFRRIG